jgi:hypothetical protein
MSQIRVRVVCFRVNVVSGCSDRAPLILVRLGARASAIEGAGAGCDGFVHVLIVMVRADG